MRGHSHQKTTLGGISFVVCALVSALPVPGWSQTGSNSGVQVDAYDVRLDTSVIRLSLPPGGFVQVSGTVSYGPEGSTIDAATEQTPQGRREAGLIDPVASGLELRDRDDSGHRYTYHVGNVSGSSCASVGMQPPCLVLRLPQLAAARLRDVDEFREELSGSLRVEVYQSIAPPVVQPTYSPSPNPHVQPNYGPAPDEGTGWFWLGAAGSGTGILLSVGIIFLALRRRRRGLGPIGRVQATAGRLRRRISSDPVKSRLLSVVNDLAAETEKLADLEKRLDKAVKNANPDALERRRQELVKAAEDLATRGGAEAGQGEMNDAAKIVEGQLDRCRRWEMQRWRSAARVERIATRLEALEVELNDPSQSASEPKEELLNVLQEELDLARAGEQEAHTLLGSPPSSSSSDEQAA